MSLFLMMLKHTMKRTQHNVLKNKMGNYIKILDALFKVTGDEDTVIHIFSA